jgi:transposase
VEVAQLLFAGIDWSDDHHDVVAYGNDGAKVAAFRVAHSAEGLEELCRKLSALEGSPQSVACIIETRHGLLITALLEAGFSVYPVNPKTVDRFRNAAEAKTDPIDATILARYGLHELDRLRKLEPDSPIVQELKTLTRDQSGLIAQQTRLVNQLTACLKAYYPVALEFFGKLQQPATLAFLQAFPTLGILRTAEPAEIAALLKSKRYPRPNETASRIAVKAREPQLEADPITTRAKARLMLAIVAQLAPLADAIKDYDTEIQRLFTAHSDSLLFQSLPGAGKRLAPRLLAEWGDDRSRYASHESVGALAGTSPVPHQSGRMRRARKRRACVKPFRCAMYQFAWQSTLTEVWAKEFYSRKRREGKSHSVAVRALSNVWVRIIFAMWRERRPYDSERFVSAQVEHGRRAA